MKKPLLLIAAFGLILSTAACNDSFEVSDTFEKATQFIINGTVDNSEAHHGVVALYIQNAFGACDASDAITCTGTLIHPQYVLTAAHCVTERNDSWEIFELDPCTEYMHIGIGKDNHEVSQNLYDIEAFYPSEAYDIELIDFDYATIKADIALIKLQKPIPDAVAKPIPVMPPWLAISSDELGSTGLDMEFSGYGYDEKGASNKKLKFTGRATQYCGAANPSDELIGCQIGPTVIDGCHPSPDICAEQGRASNETAYVFAPYGSFYYAQNEGGPCQGDSGGPGFMSIGDKEYLASITSYGDRICGVYGISTATQDFYDWLLGLAPELADVYVEICDNGLDDSGNGLIDCDDLACQDAENCLKNEEICDNGLDDSGNGLIDCDDPACQDAENCLWSWDDLDLESGCSANSKSPDATPPTLCLLALLGLVILRKRESEQQKTR